EKHDACAAESTVGAETGLKKNKERERSDEKAEKKITETEEKLKEQQKARDESHAHEIDEARKLLQARDREIVKRDKAVDGLQESLHAANEALQRKEIELKTELTRAKTQLESE